MPSYEDDLSRFEDYNIPSHKAWAKSLGGISYPLLSDFWPHGQVAADYGVLTDEGYSARALLIIDGTGTVGWIDVHPIEEQPDNEELFDILQTLR
jgi:alkyl hydroperoxide reductase subunit AhpC